MNICTEFFVFPGLPVIPAPESESVTYVTGQFPVSIDSCLRRNDGSLLKDSGAPDRCLRGHDLSQGGLF
jgi:hypothetical protein